MKLIQLDSTEMLTLALDQATRSMKLLVQFIGSTRATQKFFPTQVC